MDRQLLLESKTLVVDGVRLLFTDRRRDTGATTIERQVKHDAMQAAFIVGKLYQLGQILGN